MKRGNGQVTVEGGGLVGPPQASWQSRRAKEYSPRKMEQMTRRRRCGEMGKVDGCGVVCMPRRRNPSELPTLDRHHPLLQREFATPAFDDVPAFVDGGS